jgi:hypothetical protein
LFLFLAPVETDMSPEPGAVVPGSRGISISIHARFGIVSVSVINPRGIASFQHTLPALQLTVCPNG